MYGSVNGDLTQKLEDTGRQNDEKMTRKTGNAQSHVTFFRDSAVVSLPAVLLRKVSNGDPWPRGTINFDFILLEFFRFYLNFLFKLRMKLS